jgi:hypothetical protein
MVGKHKLPENVYLETLVVDGEHFGVSPSVCREIAKKCNRRTGDFNYKHKSKYLIGKATGFNYYSPQTDTGSELRLTLSLREFIVNKRPMALKDITIAYSPEKDVEFPGED